MFGMEISLCSPESFQPGKEIQSILQKYQLSPTWSFHSAPEEGAKEADFVYTDVWVSMGCESDRQSRLEAMNPYQVNERVMSFAKEHSLFMHCMPAHSGEEVSQAVLDSKQAILLTRQKIGFICKRPFFPYSPNLILK